MLGGQDFEDKIPSGCNTPECGQVAMVHCIGVDAGDCSDCFVTFADAGFCDMSDEDKATAGATTEGCSACVFEMALQCELSDADGGNAGDACPANCSTDFNNAGHCDLALSGQDFTGHLSSECNNMVCIGTISLNCMGTNPVDCTSCVSDWTDAGFCGKTEEEQAAEIATVTGECTSCIFDLAIACGLEESDDGDNAHALIAAFAFILAALQF